MKKYYFNLDNKDYDEFLKDFGNFKKLLWFNKKNWIPQRKDVKKFVLYLNNEKNDFEIFQHETPISFKEYLTDYKDLLEHLKKRDEELDKELDIVKLMRELKIL